MFLKVSVNMGITPWSCLGVPPGHARWYLPPPARIGVPLSQDRGISNRIGVPPKPG